MHGSLRTSYPLSFAKAIYRNGYISKDDKSVLHTSDSGSLIKLIGLTRLMLSENTKSTSVHGSHGITTVGQGLKVIC
jgi:hypothetical protein